MGVIRSSSANRRCQRAEEDFHVTAIRGRLGRFDDLELATSFDLFPFYATFQCADQIGAQIGRRNNVIQRAYAKGPMHAVNVVNSPAISPSFSEYTTL